MYLNTALNLSIVADFLRKTRCLSVVRRRCENKGKGLERDLGGPAGHGAWGWKQDLIDFSRSVHCGASMETFIPQMFNGEHVIG